MSSYPRKKWRENVAEEMIRQIKAGTAPWQKPWEPGVIGHLQHNPKSDRAYRGINALWLEMQGYDDPRWLTLKQANELGAQVRPGEKAIQVEYWQWKTTRPMIGEDSAPVLDENGKPRMESINLDRPRVFYANVFNAEQIDGLEPYKAPEPTFEPIDEAEKVLTAGGVQIHHDQKDRAFYSPADDQIRLPAKAAFPNAYEYYATALHELGHATGHRDRLARDYGPFGSETYAKEELRAEMASYITARDLGLGHFPERHANYVEGWAKAIEEDHNVLFQAARDAEQIATWIKEPELRPRLERDAQSKRKVTTMERKQQKKKSAENSADKPKRVYLAVPFSDKDVAKEHGAKWDRLRKSWYVLEGTNMEPLKKWLPENQPELKPEVDPRKEFADELKRQGILIKGEPLMDGKWHRAQLEGDGKGQRNASYRAFLDGRPNGQIHNYKTQETTKWVATGETLSPEQRAKLEAEAAQKQQQRQEERQKAHQAAAEKAADRWKQASTWEELKMKSSPSSAYLYKKQVENYGLRVENAAKQDQKLLVPAQDIDGKLWSVQAIDEGGNKRFQKDARKYGLMHVIDPEGKIGTPESMIIVGEGYATLSDVHDATKQPSVVAFDAGNLKAVAEALRKKYPENDIVIAADNDHKLEHKPYGNVGMNKGNDAAKAVNGVLVAPKFDDEQKAKGLTDWNDLKNDQGLKAVADQIRQQLKQQKTKTKSQDREQEHAVAM